MTLSSIRTERAPTSAPDAVESVSPYAMSLLRSHQKEALQRLKNGSILVGGVGSGKSMVAAAHYVADHSHRNVCVITTAKKRDSLDWNREFARFSVGTTSGATVAGVLTVDSWNSIHKYEEIEDAFFIFDEQRLVGSGGWVKSFLRIARRNRWILLSATPGDTWLDYIAVFIAHGFYKNRTEFKARHVVYKPYTKFPAVDHYIDTGRLLKLRSQIVVEMPFDRHTTRHTVVLPVDFDEDQMNLVLKKRWNPYLQQPIKNPAEMWMLARKVANTHPDRKDELLKILEKHPRVIVFYNFNYELEILREIEGVQIAEWNGQKHQPIPNAERWLYLVQYSAGAEGWECIDTNAVYFWSQTYSYKLWEQSYGRIDRLNTPFHDLWYYLPMSKSFIDKAIRRAILGKRDFNELEVSDLF